MKKALADALERRGYKTLTPVQKAVSDPDLVNADLLVSAQTGSGKTVGFGLAIAPTLLGDREKFPAAGAPLALIIAPTRELAMQVKRELGWLYEDAGAVVASCVGGMDMRGERRALARGAHIVVATPGRLRDHIMRGSINLGGLRAVVLDEADEMLDLGFREDLEFILGEAPVERQTLLFSATVPQPIARLAKSYQRDAVRITTTAGTSQHADIEYQAMMVSPRDGENAIINVLRFYEAPNALVFCNTRDMVNRMTTRLSNRGFSVVALSGELSQNERTHALQSMRDGRARICVATDVAARGIDLPNLDLVVHAELPSNHETLLHRSGRTGRAGRKGVCVLVVPPKARKKAERILRTAQVRAEWGKAPSAEAVMARDQDRLLADPSWHEEIGDTQRALVDSLVNTFTAEQIAAAFLRLYQDKHSAPEELADVNEKPEPRADFGPSVWFSVSGGRAENAEPRRLLPMLCKVGGLTKNEIGAIRIQQDESFVEIKAASAAGFLTSIGKKMRVEGAVVKQLDKAPSFARGPKDGFKPKSRGPKRPPAKSENAIKSAPNDWNDDPTPRTRKPKPAAKKGAARRSTEGRKPKHPGKGKKGNPSLKTPTGKPSSKKNRARAKAAAGKGGAGNSKGKR
ncbi:MAG TPA: DEAD/DEAH box helicase [Aliiroseovarius sp.]|nr:DEAD/DEAH box helicase [Aliiroseovarius sp.]